MDANNRPGPGKDIGEDSGNSRANVKVDRRAAILAGAAGLGALCLPSRDSAARQTQPHPYRRPFTNYEQLLNTLERRGHKLRVLGLAPDRSPLVAVRAGGDKLPAIFISAGSHSTEHAGVAAAVELIDRLKTRHQVWVLPTRDPIGLNGFRYTLSLALNEVPELKTVQDAEALLRKRGEVLLDDGETLLVQIGEYGYANLGLYRKLEKGSKPLESLRGRRIYFPAGYDDVPGTGPLERAYTLIVTPDAEVLHLNRFHDTPWAPSEVRCARQLMAEIQPELTFDLHEHSGGGFYWMSARRQRTEDLETWERRLAAAGVRAVAATGAQLAPETYSPGSFFEKLEPGVFWLDATQRGEGLNLVDFAANRYGLGFTIETGMRGPFEKRVEQHLAVVQTAVELFESRYA